MSHVPCLGLESALLFTPVGEGDYSIQHSLRMFSHQERERERERERTSGNHAHHFEKIQ